MTYLKVKEIGGGDNDSELLVFPDFDLKESLLEEIEDARGGQAGWLVEVLVLLLVLLLDQVLAY